MLVDKDFLLALGAAFLTVVFFSFFIFAPGTTGGTSIAPDDMERPLYAPDDIRYQYQQAELKNPKKKQAKVKESFVTDGSTSAGAGNGDIDESVGEPSNEEPDVTDHPPQEEPDLE